MKKKPINPYSALLERAQTFEKRVFYPIKKPMHSIPKNRLEEGWSLLEIWARITAADQLGYDVKLEATETSLDFKYVARPRAEYF